MSNEKGFEVFKEVVTLIWVTYLVLSIIQYILNIYEHVHIRSQFFFFYDFLVRNDYDIN